VQAYSEANFQMLYFKYICHSLQASEHFIMICTLKENASRYGGRETPATAAAQVKKGPLV
jgi:hypothetical protein